MKSTALTLTSDKYFERYAKFITEADGNPQRITSADDLEKYDVLVLSGGGDMGILSGAYGEQTDNLPIGGVNDDRDLFCNYLKSNGIICSTYDNGYLNFVVNFGHKISDFDILDELLFSD